MEQDNTAAGVSKKQQRIVDLVSAQLGQQLRASLLQELEARLQPVREGASPPPSNVAPDGTAPTAAAASGEEVRALARAAAEALGRLAAVGEGAGGRASRAIPPSGWPAPAADLQGEYQRRLGALRPGDLAAVMELKREFRRRGLEVY